MYDKKGNHYMSSELFPKTVFEKYSPEKNATSPKNIRQLEKLISGFSTDLIETSEKNLEKVLNDWLIKFVEFLKVDRCIVNEYRDNPKTMHLLINYIVPEVDTIPVVYDYQPSKGVIEELEKGMLVRAEKIPDDLPQKLRGGVIEGEKTKSTIIVPLSIGNRVIGSLSFACYRKKRKWSDDLVRLIKLIGEMIANAILRIRSHKILLEEVERRQRLEEKYTSIIKIANVGFWISDLNFRILEVNDAYCKMSGYKRDELIGMGIDQLYIAPEQDSSLQEKNTILRKGDISIEASHIRKDGTNYDVTVNSKLLEKEDVVFSFIRDITELNNTRRDLEDRLKFEELSSEFSAALVNIKPGYFNEELNHWLKKFVEFLEVDRGIINKYLDDNKTVQVLMSYTVPDVDVLPLEKTYGVPEGEIEEFQKGIIIKAERIPEELPQMLHGGLIERENTKSLVIVPLSVGDTVIGSLSFASYKKERKWSDNLIRRINLIGEIIANTIQRINSQQALSEEVERRKTMEERYSSILKTANVGFWISDRDQNILTVNDEYCRMSGYNRDELLSMKIPDIDIYFSTKKTEVTDNILNTGRAHHEVTHRRKDGSFIDLAVSSTLHRSEGVLISFMRDITELNQSRKELSERLEFEELVSEFSAALVDIKPDDIKKELECWLVKFVDFLEMDRGMVHEYINDQQNVQILIQYTGPGINIPAEKMRKTPKGVICELEKGVIRAEKIPEDLPQVFRGTFVEAQKTKSLIVVPLLESKKVFGNLSFCSYKIERKWPDDLVRRIKLIGEITGNAILRLRAHETLVEEMEHRKLMEEEYTLVLENANVGFWISDLDKNILDVNNEYCRMSGYTRDELLSMKITEIAVPTTPEEVSLITKKIEETASFHHEVTHIKKDGSFMELDVSSAVLEGKNVLFSFMRDITELNQTRRAQEERLGFEELVSDFSAALINIKLDDLNEELRRWIIKFVEFLEIGRGVINEYQYDNNTIKALVSYTNPAEEIATSPHDMNLNAPDRVMNEFKRGTTIRAEKIPGDLQAPFRGWIIEKHNTKSLVVVPLTAGNQVVGNLTFASYKKERKWSDDIFRRIKLIGEIIASAVLRKRASDALHEEMEHRKVLEKRYSTILKTANVGFWITDHDQNILVVNDEYCRMSGYRHEELTKMKISDIDISKDPKKIEKDGMLSIMGGSFKHESLHIRKDGTTFYVEISSNFLEKESVFFSFITDITELTLSRNELEERLKFEELVSEFSAALVNVKLGDYKQELKIWLKRFAVLMNVERCIIAEYLDNFTKQKAIITYIKPEVESAVRPLSEIPVPTFGYHKYLARGEILKFDSPNDYFPGELEKGMRVQIEDGTKSMLMLPLMAGDMLLGNMSFSNIETEKKWTQDLIRMLKLVAEIFANTLMRDKTDFELDNYRKNLEKIVDERTAKLQDAQDELVVSEKMATLGKLTATVSHELRNPLGTIRSSIYSVQKRLREKDKKVINALVRAERNIKRCDLIIDELLNYSRVHKLNLEPTPIDSWINEVLGEMGPPQGIVVEKKLSSGATINLDHERFRRCIVNVLTNAYQAIQEKNGDENGCVSVQTYQGNNRIIIEISDNGVGFDMDNMKKIYEPLYSTKAFGVGLGIPITSQIIEQHGWDMEIKGKPQAGTSVTITIPVADE